MSRQKIRVTRKGTGGSEKGRAIKRAAYNFKWAQAQAIAPGFHLNDPNMPYTTWKDWERRDTVPIAYLGPHIVQRLSELDPGLAKNLQGSQRTPKPKLDYMGQEEDIVREAMKREALMITYRIFKATKGKDPQWDAFVYAIRQWERAVGASPEKQDERRKRG